MTHSTAPATPDQWICDTCQGTVTATGADAGLLTARTISADDGSRHWAEFHITHKNSPHRHCDTDDDGRVLSWELHTLTGIDGMNRLLSFLSYGPVALHRGFSPDICRVGDFTSYTDVFRRLYVPNYEQARPFFTRHDTRDAHGDSPVYAPYSQDALTTLGTAAR